jgi:hypothetical protein
VIAPLVAALVFTAAARAAPPWCATDRGDDGPSSAGAVAALPESLAGRARHDEGITGDPAAGHAVVEHARRLACVGRDDTVPVDVAALRTEVAALRSDPRFAGTRADEDAVDRLLASWWTFLEGLLESRGMQGFAAHTRTVYLGALAVVAAVVAVRLLRDRRRTTARPRGPTGADAPTERARRQAFSTLRTAADAALAVDARRALLLGRAALLARLGERGDDDLLPARTTTQIVEALPARHATRVLPALRSFDHAWFGGSTVDVDGARAILALVDAAASVLERDVGDGDGDRDDGAAGPAPVRGVP